MSQLPNYNLLIGTILDGHIFPAHQQGQQPHYHWLLSANGAKDDVAMNIQSNVPAPGEDPLTASEVLYLVQNGITPPNAQKLLSLPEGVTFIKPGDGMGIDYVRTQGLVDRSKMTLLPVNPAVNHLHIAFDDMVARAKKETHKVFVFGQTFRNKGGKNPFWGFTPDQGIHDVHMNQGDGGPHSHQNGANQDGCVFIHWADGTWTMIAIAFQTQSWDTDSQGNPV